MNSLKVLKDSSSKTVHVGSSADLARQRSFPLSLHQSSPICAMSRSTSVHFRSTKRGPSRITVLKKPSLDMSNLNNYRPISNLSLMSKTVERLVDARFTAYAKNSSLPIHQSAYRSQHSTETALVHLYNDMVATVDRERSVLYVLLRHAGSIR